MTPRGGRAALAAALLAAGCLGPGGSGPRLPPGRRAAASAPAPPRGGGPRLSPPLADAAVLSPFGARGRRHHDGVDLRASKHGGEPVRAAADGVVVQTRPMRGYGRQVLVRHANGWFTRYAHLRSVRVKTGWPVHAGDMLGLVGQSGRASTPHLHFELLTDKGRPVDPMPYLKE